MFLSKSFKNMILFLTGRFVSLFGTNIYSFAMSFYVLSETKSAIFFSISILLSTLPRIIFSPFAGVISDRFDRKKLVLFFDFLSGVTMLLMFVVSLVFGLRLWMIYLSTTLLSTFNTFFDIPFGSSMPLLVEDEQLGRINSLNQTVSSLSSIFGPIIGAIVYSLIAPQLFLLLNGISFILSTIEEFFIDFNYNKKEVNDLPKENIEKEKSIKLKAVFSDMVEGFHYFRQRKGLFAVMKGSLLFNFFFSAVNVGLPVIIVIQLSSSEETLGVINSMIAVGMLGMSIALTMIKNINFGKKIYTITLILVSAVVFLMAIPIMPGAHIQISIGLYYSILAFVLGLLITLINVPFMVLIQRTVEDQYRGRVMAFVTTLASAITPLGVMIHGILYEKIKPYIILGYAGLATLIVCFFLIYWLRGIELNETPQKCVPES